MMLDAIKTCACASIVAAIVTNWPAYAGQPVPYETLIDPAADTQSTAAIFEAYKSSGSDAALAAVVQAYIQSGKAKAAWDIIENHGDQPTKAFFEAKLAAVNAQLAQAGTFGKLSWARTLKKTCTQRNEREAADETALECLAKFHNRAPSIAGGDEEAGRAALAALTTQNPARGYLVQAEIVFPDDPEAARGLVDKALAYDTVYDEGLIQAAMVYGYFKDWDGVTTALGRVDETSDIAGMQYYQLGKLSAEMGERLQDGEAALIRFLQGDTIYQGVDFRGPAHWRLGQIFALQERNQLAKTAFERALGHMPRLSAAKKDLKAIKTRIKENR